MKNLPQKIAMVIAGILIGPLAAFAVQISVPSAPGTGYMLISTTTGAYIATTTNSIVPSLPISILNGGTGTTTATSGQLLYGGTSAYQSVATTSVTCSGSTTCTSFTAIGNSPITISSVATGSGLSTTTPISPGNLLAYSATGAGSTYGTATSTLNATSPLTGSFTQVGSGGALGIQVANTSQNGYLSSTDWNTFNGKVSSQWTGTSPGSIYYQTGNVGIGTSSPYAALSVSTTTQESGATLFAVASSTNATLFNVLGNGNVGINAPSFFSFNRSTLTPQLQLNGIDNNNGISIINHTASNIGANLVLGKTSGTTAGTFSALSNGNTISRIFFTGSVNSTDASTTAAIILATVDGTPTATTLPGSLAFQTTQAGSTGTPVTRMTISNAGDVGINSTPQYYAKLYVSTATTTLTNGPATIVTGLTTVMNQTPASASSATIFGQYNTAQWAGSADSSASGSLTGAQFGANLSGAASLNSITGLVNQTVGGGSGTIVTAMGGQYNVSEQGGGTITNAYAGIFNNNSSGAGSVITNSKGLWVAGTSVSGGGSIVNNEGLYVDDQSGGTNNVNFYTGPAGVYATGNYALYDNSAYNNYFKGNTGVGSTTPGSLLSIGNSGWNFYDNATSTKSGTGGINITDGCYAKNGVCIGTGGGAGTVTSIATNNGITGGTITTTGTIGLAAIAANSVLGNVTGASGVPSAVATSSLFTGTTGQGAYFASTGGLVGTSTLFITAGATVGVGTTTTVYGANSFTQAISNGVTALGGLLINTVTNVTNAFSIFNATGANVFNVDTTASNPFLGVGTSTPYSTISAVGNATNPIFALASTTNSGLPNFSVDKTGIVVTSGVKPVVSSCGTTNSISGNDMAGSIVFTGTLVTTCTMTFATPVPAGQTLGCVVSDNSTTGFSGVTATSTTAVTFGISTGLASGAFFYSCNRWQ